MPGNAVKRTRGRPANGDGVRSRILKAAHELFTEKGYRATTTKEITARAGVAEPTLFRHFGSKVDLFEASILEPFTAFVDRWSRSWVDYSAEASVEDLAENLVDSLYSLIREDRLVFQELMAARSALSCETACAPCTTPVSTSRPSVDCSTSIHRRPWARSPA
jgi:AcrR family transcriptional regulator